MTLLDRSSVLEPKSFTKSGLRIQLVFDFPGFRVALGIASLPGMTIKLCNELLRHDTSGARTNRGAKKFFNFRLFAVRVPAGSMCGLADGSGTMSRPLYKFLLRT